MTILAFAGIVGSWIIGAMDQKLGTKKTMIFFGIWYACALLCNFTNTKAGFWISIIMIGIGNRWFRKLHHFSSGICIRKKGFDK